MDIGRIAIFTGLVIYFLYKYFKKKKEIYLIFALCSWLSSIYVGNFNLYRLMPETVKSGINTISILLTAGLIIIISKPLFKEYIKEKFNKKI